MKKMNKNKNETIRDSLAHLFELLLNPIEEILIMFFSTAIIVTCNVSKHENEDYNEIFKSIILL